jgi:hypothetical protein
MWCWLTVHEAARHVVRAYIAIGAHCVVGCFEQAPRSGEARDEEDNSLNNSDGSYYGPEEAISEWLEGTSGHATNGTASLTASTGTGVGSSVGAGATTTGSAAAGTVHLCWLCGYVCTGTRCERWSQLR